MASDYDFQTIRIGELEAKLQRAEETLAKVKRLVIDSYPGSEAEAWAALGKIARALEEGTPHPNPEMVRKSMEAHEQGRHCSTEGLVNKIKGRKRDAPK